MADENRKKSPEPQKSEKDKTPRYTLRSAEDTAFANKKYTFKKNAPGAQMNGAAQSGGTPQAHIVTEAADKKVKNQRAVQSMQQKKDESNGKLRKKAAYIKESIQESIKSSCAESYEETADAAVKYEAENNAFENTSAEKKSESLTEKFTEKLQTEQHRGISEQTAQRMKKAAFIKEMTESRIAADRSYSYAEEENESVESEQTSVLYEEENNDGDDKKENGNFTSRYLGNTELAAENKYEDKRHNAAKGDT